MKRVTSIIAFLFVCVSLFSQAEVTYTKQDSLIFEDYVKQFSSKRDLPIGELAVETAKYFLGKPYVAHTLEVNDKEQLVVNLREFDCTTFVESCMALVQVLKDDNPSFDRYCYRLHKIRYRGEEIEDYSSRLHYISDWAYENRDILINVSKKSKNYLETKQIDFISTHTDSYRQLKNNEELQNKIKKSETELNKRGGFYVIRKEDITDTGKSLKNGDIVAFATSLKGLDCSHIGLIYYEKGILKFIHASSAAKKVIIERRSLRDYCFDSKRCTGVMIFRQQN